MKMWSVHKYKILQINNDIQFLNEGLNTEFTQMLRIFCLLIVALVLLSSVESKPDPCGGGGCGSTGGCYCSGFTFHDWNGIEHGNCNTADPSGLKWCYVSRWSSCYHMQRSQR